MIRKRLVFALCAFSGLFCKPIYAGTIKGKVIDKNIKDNLKDCMVYDSTSNCKDITDSFGNFALTGRKKGRHVILVTSGTHSNARYIVNLLNDEVSIQVFKLVPKPPEVKPGCSLLMGKVFDKTTKDPIPGCVLCIDSLRIGINTDKDGSYMLNDIPVGMHTITIKMMGYEYQKQNILFVGGKNHKTKYISKTVKHSV